MIDVTKGIFFFILHLFFNGIKMNKKPYLETQTNINKTDVKQSNILNFKT